MQVNLLSFSTKDENSDFTKHKTLIEIFKKTVENYKEKVALHFKNEELSYYELDQYSDFVAQSLIESGTMQGDLIGVYLPRGLDLHITILGILKAGAGYIPFDIETPIERVVDILAGLSVKKCFSETNISPKFKNITPIKNKLLNNNCPNFSNPSEIAYIIFTSGTTGKPKGIPIKHYQICHLIQAENSVLSINAQDHVYQGFSVSFDMWFEETWISYLVGATLYISDANTAKSFDKLHQFMNQHKISVLHAVPSLLALIDSQIPSLRLINAGGEACNNNIVNKWAKPEISFFNSYGPTETTVTSSLIQLKPGDEISIGFPLPNYEMCIVNENLEAVPIGTSGELVISGIGLSEGYLNLPELTKNVFLAKPESLSEMVGDRIYLSGDVGVMQENGSFKVFGRKDDQIKIRGYRVELGEIEAKLNAIFTVKKAVIDVRKINAIDQLIAFIKCNPNENLDEKYLRNELNKVLPVYMVPNFFVEVEDFSYLTSGKVNKKELPAFNPYANSTEQNTTFIAEYSTNPLLEQIALKLSNLFPGQNIEKENDFFNGLGGHSLLAAYFVSEVREIKGMENVSIMDVYENRPIEKLFSYWKDNISTLKEVKNEDFQAVSKLNYYCCWLAQSFALLFIYGLVATQIFLPYLGYYVAALELEGHLLPIIIAILLYCIVIPVSSFLVILLKKCFIGKLSEGDFPMWGLTYFKWWFQKRLFTLIPKETVSNTPLFPILLKWMGVAVAEDAQLSNFEIGAEDLVSIGKNVTISSNVVLNNAWVENGLLKLRKITIEDDAYIGTSAVVSGRCSLKRGSELKDLSCLAKEQIIPALQTWGGSPAKLSFSKETFTERNVIPKKTFKKYKLLFLMLVFLFPIVVILPLTPSIIILYTLDENADFYSFYYLLQTPLFSLSYLLLFVIEIILLSKLLRKNIKEGTFSIYSPVYLRVWFLDQLFSLSLNVIKPIFATIFITSIYRLLGAKVGENTEISTASNVTHHLLEIGDGSFVADDVVLGESEVKNQEITLIKTIIGNKSFVGNSALIPQGYELGNNMLIGVLSVPPTNEQFENTKALDWFGSPAISLPRREIRDDYPAHLTFQPSRYRRIARGIVEFIRILIPQSVILSLSILFIAYVHDLITQHKIEEILILFPFYYLGFVAIPCFLISLMLKWILIGRYKTAEYPMWTLSVWMTEAVTSIYEALAIPFFLIYLKGTPFLPIMLRLMGVKIGKRVFLDTSDLTEFDMVTIGNDCALNTDSGPQTHLFEDRVMKIGKIEIGAETSIGAKSVVLYGSKIEKNCQIEALSLVMKGEKLPEKTNWSGIPIKIQ
jgi:non-ribosomal peptide synthetase-like protein